MSAEHGETAGPEANAPLQDIRASDTTAKVLLEAVIAMSSHLELHSVLARIVESAATLTGAKYGALGVIGAGGVLDDFVTYGIDPDEQERIGDLPSGHGILGLLIRHPRPLRLQDIQAHPETSGFPDDHPPMKTFLGVPVRIRGTIWGNLYLTEKEGGFTEEDITLTETLATAAGVGIERAQAVADRADLAVLSDRERIARDLHDNVIQRIFATGLRLQGVALKAPEIAEQVAAAVDELDQTIRDIRSTIFELEHRGGSSLRKEIREVLRTYIGILGFTPTVRITGPLDTAVPGPIREHLVAVMREGLSNISRHARAQSAELELSVEPGSVSFRILDDGVGVTEGEPLSGLRNLKRRAHELGGTFELRPRAGGGTEFLWQVPLAR
ncbi:GAF domain-containing protein [Nocardioides sp. Kera G14]|uniref:GAF domain-containing sensor histidine kinase n=1 Tax=Nocardioides sp. Kera G14 TaxID=2884264 RepID=UPI001D109799|nr:GAF domain-containing protein [Nocardioides sp. Kera G14]UDY22974.1 GAF domain-containing protein [Nocardioides sp. Kera G14]